MMGWTGRAQPGLSNFLSTVGSTAPYKWKLINVFSDDKEHLTEITLWKFSYSINLRAIIFQVKAHKANNSSLLKLYVIKNVLYS